MMIGTVSVELDGADPTTRKESIQTIKRFVREFPRAAGLLARVELRNLDQFGADGVTYQLGKTPDDGIGPIVSGDRYVIALNTGSFGAGNRAVLLHLGKESELAGWSVVNNPKSILEHELGHVIDMCASQDAGTYSHPLSVEKIDYVDALITGSKYAMESGAHEVFADAFAGYWDSENVKPKSPRVLAYIRDAARVSGFNGTFEGK